MQDGINMWFPTPVYYAYGVVSPDVHNKIIDTYEEHRDKIMEPAHNWFCDVKTSYNKFDMAYAEEFKPLIDSIKTHIHNFCMQLSSSPSTIECDHAWINSSVRDQYQEQHTHPNSHISAIYYLKTPEGSADTIFKNPYEKHSRLPRQQMDVVSRQDVSYLAEEGKLLLFESHVPHLTERHKSDEERLTFSANFTVK